MLLFASDLSAYVIPIIFVVLVVVLIVINFIRKSNYQKNADELFNGLEPGDKVKTYAGIYGEIVSVRDARDGSRVAVIKTGDEEHYSYLEIDIASVYALDQKDVEPEVVEEVETEETKEEAQTTDVEEVKEEVVEQTEEVTQEENAEVVEEEKPKKKTKKAKAE